MLKIGCCGFPVAKPEYYRELKLVELQSTFYKLPREETARRWREEAPPDFEFTLKAWQGVTHRANSPTYRKAKVNIPEEKRPFYGHFQPSEEVRQAWEETLRIARALQASTIVLQCPPNFKDTEENIRNLQVFFRNANVPDIRLALELRAVWNPEIVRNICREYGIIHCVDPFKEDALTEGVYYFRLHGSPPGPKMYSYRYTETDFQQLATRINSLLEKEGEIYLLFNNLNMWNDARAFGNFWENQKHTFSS